MGYYCTVPQCTSLAGKTKNVKFHRFPRDVTMADKWNLILKRGKPYTKYSKVCSLHFTQADYNVTTMGQWKTLSKDAVPSQNLPKLNPDGTVMVIRKSRTVKYREGKKDDLHHGEKPDKWSLNLGAHSALPTEHMICDPLDSNVPPYRYQPVNTLNHSPAPLPKPKKQDAIMQTDPVNSDDDDSQPNNSYSEVSDMSYPSHFTKDDFDKKYEAKDYTNKPDDYLPAKDYTNKPEDYLPAKDYTNKPEDYLPAKDYNNKQDDYLPAKDYTTKQDDYIPAKDYTTKQDDYLPQTNEEYNKEAEKYALERKSLNGYEKQLDSFSKPVESYQKMPDLYSGFEKPFRPDYVNFQTFPDSVELLRNQQHNLQMLQEQHRITENQNFFNENHIKQEIEPNMEDDKFAYERNKEQIDADLYSSRRLVEQQRLLEQIQHQVKQEPDATQAGCDAVMQPQGSPYYQSNTHNNVSGGYYEHLSRPGPELLIAKQNALAAHTQLWQNTMKRPFFYSDSPHYNGAPLLHRYEDITRILQ